MGVRVRGTLGDVDPLSKVPFKRARSRVPFKGVSLILPRTPSVYQTLCFQGPYS